ncbi:uncharacterized protein TA18435 [Theileria annulata]|uniref:Uncharacterized protein n=1 Tax=Theileria annulata TaxID=5874 RepID=Q4UAW8_THEAN|nr:uncharacterized protein TA18435 [Theileria annulata]CAI76033.1 hypothetical protein TA18435 [Theileria annulata]|eukprot:XP_955509.1 hypothetical protein TA18435 [Theileria annulata]
MLDFINQTESRFLLDSIHETHMEKSKIIRIFKIIKIKNILRINKLTNLLIFCLLICLSRTGNCYAIETRKDAGSDFGPFLETPNFLETPPKIIEDSVMEEIDALDDYNSKNENELTNSFSKFFNRSKFDLKKFDKFDNLDKNFDKFDALDNFDDSDDSDKFDDSFDIPYKHSFDTVQTLNTLKKTDNLTCGTDPFEHDPDLKYFKNPKNISNAENTSTTNKLSNDNSLDTVDTKDTNTNETPFRGSTDDSVDGMGTVEMEDELNSEEAPKVCPFGFTSGNKRKTKTETTKDSTDTNKSDDMKSDELKTDKENLYLEEKQFEEKILYLMSSMKKLKKEILGKNAELDDLFMQVEHLRVSLGKFDSAFYRTLFSDLETLSRDLNLLRKGNIYYTGDNYNILNNITVMDALRALFVIYRTPFVLLRHNFPLYNKCEVFIYNFLRYKLPKFLYTVYSRVNNGMKKGTNYLYSNSVKYMRNTFIYHSVNKKTINIYDVLLTDYLRDKMSVDVDKVNYSGNAFINKLINMLIKLKIVKHYKYIRYGVFKNSVISMVFLNRKYILDGYVVGSNPDFFYIKLKDHKTLEVLYYIYKLKVMCFLEKLALFFLRYFSMICNLFLQDPEKLYNNYTRPLFNFESIPLFNFQTMKIKNLYFFLRGVSILALQKVDVFMDYCFNYANKVNPELSILVPKDLLNRIFFISVIILLTVIMVFLIQLAFHILTSIVSTLTGNNNSKTTISSRLRHWYHKSFLRHFFQLMKKSLSHGKSHKRKHRYHRNFETFHRIIDDGNSDLILLIITNTISMVIGNMDITYPKKDKAIDIPKDTVKIKTGTVNADGNCTETAKEIKGDATITPATQTEGPKLTIKDITGADALATIAGTPCNVSVDTEKKTLTINYTQGTGKKCIEIEITGINTKKTGTASATTVQYGHIFTETFDTSKVHWPEIISPTLMVIVGMILLVITIFPPVIVAALRKTAPLLGNWSHYQSPMCKWGADEKDQQDKWTNTGETWTSGDTTGSQDASFWHGFDLLIVLKILLASAVLWSKAYWEGDKAKDGYPPSDPNQRECKKLNVAATTSGSGTELTYTIGQNFAENHAKDNCGFKNSPTYYAHLVPPSLMVLVGMELPLPNITIVTTVISGVFIMELLRIVLDSCKTNIGDSRTTSTEGESTTPFETTFESNINGAGECERLSRRISILGDFNFTFCHYLGTTSEGSSEFYGVIVVEGGAGLDRAPISGKSHLIAIESSTKS